MISVFCNFMSQVSKLSQYVVNRQFSDWVQGAYAPVAPVEELKRYIMECMGKLGTPECNSVAFTDSLIQADYRGMRHYGITNMESNHFGSPALYSIQAQLKGFIGMSFTNSSPIMVPTNAKDVALGSNPLSIAAPGMKCDSLIVDIPATEVSPELLEDYKEKRWKIPKGWALDDTGREVTDPEKAINFGRLLPLGGHENYRGMGLALLAEALSGILAGANSGLKIRTWGEKTAGAANLGHGFIAINPEKFVPNFTKRLTDLLNEIRSVDPADPKNAVFVPGDKERAHMKKVEKEGGIYYPKSVRINIEKISKLLNVDPIEFRTCTC